MRLRWPGFFWQIEPHLGSTVVLGEGPSCFQNQNHRHHCREECARLEGDLWIERKADHDAKYRERTEAAGAHDRFVSDATYFFHAATPQIGRRDFAAAGNENYRSLPRITITIKCEGSWNFGRPGKKPRP